MTYSYTKTAVLSIFALATLLTACKKDKEAETAASFKLSTLSLDFEWGQSKELTYTTHRIVSIDDPTNLPAGWTCTMGDDRFIITAPVQSSSAVYASSIKFSATTDTGTTITNNLVVTVMIAEEITDSANSFIINRPGKRYKFNALRRGNETAETITGAVSATRLWSTSGTTVSNVSLEENGYIYFRTGGTDKVVPGNALIVLMDENEKALWSWHIWVTDYDPTNLYDIINGMEVMNRNLGALASSNATPEELRLSYGLYYQWGRKDPFVGPALWDSTTPQTLLGNSNSFVTYNFAVSNVDNNEKDEFNYPGTVEFATAYPAIFIAGSEDNDFDWLMTSNDGLWSPTSKTIYDPCPAGWRVAPPEIWADFTTTGSSTGDPSEFNVDGEYEYGWNFSTGWVAEPTGPITTFFPAAGRRSFSPSLANTNSNYTNIVNKEHGEPGYPVGFYWSSRKPDTKGGLAFRHDYINPGDTADDVAGSARASGFPLRCIADK